MQPVSVLSQIEIDKVALNKLDEEFPGLISDTNLLAEKVKQLSVIKMVTLEERYQHANKKVPLVSLRSDLDPIIRENNKKFFFWI